MSATIQAFLLGVLATMSVIAGVFFLRYWRETRDSFFLAFAAAFITQGLGNTAQIFMAHPNEGSPWLYIVRLLAFLLIVIAILRKNYGKK